MVLLQGRSSGDPWITSSRLDKFANLRRKEVWLSGSDLPAILAPQDQTVRSASSRVRMPTTDYWRPEFSCKHICQRYLGKSSGLKQSAGNTRNRRPTEST